ncbi:hypothetical protein [Chryseobacterium takakiae]|uniref:YopX protein domain-containing protein n=1 Tax=Chryseobacterium takakiae TaxID=1302685 RepID=A0A1M4Z7G6_9FLAO|nr:hypothetical protein [Chryseobacterium takakiae]SHF14023.1 hypothetical protein SAMN05444408_109152 [Chryseobacterium takakiae]
MFSKDNNVFDEFKQGTKVFLDGEYGVIVQIDGPSTIIHWDTPKENDYEDWFSCWGPFIEMGGKIINKDYIFTYINDEGVLKD